jgi:tryptophan synthase alpha chain
VSGRANESKAESTGADRIAAAIRRATSGGRPAIAAFLTAGYPSREGFADQARAVAREADLVELGVPFSDPMADGLTIQRSSRAALQSGVTLPWILDQVERIGRDTSTEGTADHDDTPILLMSYTNPVMAHGFSRLADEAAAVGVAGLIVPDLPLEESDELRGALEAAGVALVQLVTPATPPERLRRVCEASAGFVYAVTMKGTTGARVDSEGAAEYLSRVRAVSPCPVLAGFGVRTAEDVRSLGRFADGVIVGSALVEAQEAGRDPAAFVGELRGPIEPGPGETER